MLQLQTIPYDRPWHDMSREVRREAVRRVHEVIFSQVMAITHSMLELGCRAEQAREFLYRMCVIHQLSEAMRQTLLKHVAAAAKANHVHAHANGRRASSRRYSANSVHSANSSAHGGANNSRRSSAVSTTEEEQEAQPPAAQQALPVSAIQTLPSAPHLSVNGNPVAASVPLPPSPPQNSLSTNNELGDSVAV